MTDDATAAPAPSALQRASDGRLGGLSIFDPRLWREAVTLHSAPAWAVIGVCVGGSVLAILHVMRGGEPWDWSLSAAALSEGRWYALISHMFAHAGHWHLFLNSTFLLGVTPVVMARFGVGPSGWLRYAVLFLVSGLLGAGLYLALHLDSAVPMVGASGAICGVWGAASRIGPEGGIVPIRSEQVWVQVKAFAKMNLILFGLLFVLVRMTGGQGGLAWEAHLGGFLFGLFAVPWLAPRPCRERGRVRHRLRHAPAPLGPGLRRDDDRMRASNPPPAIQVAKTNPPTPHGISEAAASFPRLGPASCDTAPRPVAREARSAGEPKRRRERRERGSGARGILVRPGDGLAGPPARRGRLR